MGLRFRKSITLLPGVKLNFGKTGASLSVGGKGFHQSIHTSGKATTTISAPGTGVSYVKTKNIKTFFKKKNKDADAADAKKKGSKKDKKEELEAAAQPVAQETAESAEPEVEALESVAQISADTAKSIHKYSDDAIDWAAFAANDTAPQGVDADLWQYYHEKAGAILSGDVDAYLDVIGDVNPLGDLVQFGSNFEFGTDDPAVMEVEYVINSAALETAKSVMEKAMYNELLQDFISSMSIRIARDVFALLPVKNVIVHAVDNEKTVLSSDFDRETLASVNFALIDPSDTIARFRHNMKFNKISGMAEVERLA